MRKYVYTNEYVHHLCVYTGLTEYHGTGCVIIHGCIKLFDNQHMSI